MLNSKKLTTTVLISLIFCFSQSSFGELGWKSVNPLPIAGHFVDINFTSPELGFLLTDANLLLKTVNSGDTWSRVPLPENESLLKAIKFYDEETGWIIGSPNPDNRLQHKAYFTQDGGDNWERHLVGSEENGTNLTCINVMPDGKVLFGGSIQLEDDTHPVVLILTEDSVRVSILPDGERSGLINLFFLNNSLGWAVGENGYIAFTFTGGDRWESAERSTQYDLNSIHFTNAFIGWAVGGNFNNAVLLSSANGGETWSVNSDHPAESMLTSVYSFSRSAAIAVCSGGDQFRSQVIETENGRDWHTIYSIGRNLQCLSVVENSIYVGGRDNFLIHSSNRQNWSQLSRDFMDGSVFDLFFLDQDRGWVSGSNGKIFKTTDRGNRWREIETGFYQPIVQCVFTDDNNGWFTGQSSAEYSTSDGGGNWNEINISEEDVTLLKFIGNTGYACHNLSVAVTHDGGENWESTEVIQGDGLPIISLSVPDSETAFVASPGDVLRITSDGGESWRTMDTPFENIYGVSFINRETGWVLGFAPRGGIRLYYTNDGGDSWTGGDYFNQSPGGLHFIDRSTGWLWENPGVVHMTNDGGQSWENMDLSIGRILRDMQGFASDNLWLCGDGSLITHWSSEELNVSLPVGSKPSSVKLFSCYPNPVNGNASITVNLLNPGTYSISLMDLSGRAVFNNDRQKSFSGREVAFIPLLGLPSGQYWIKVRGKGMQEIKSITLLK